MGIFILFFLGEEDEHDKKKKDSYNSSSKTREKSHSSGFTGMTGSQKTKTAGATPNSMGDSSSGYILYNSLWNTYPAFLTEYLKFIFLI